MIILILPYEESILNEIGKENICKIIKIIKLMFLITIAYNSRFYGSWCA